MNLDFATIAAGGRSLLVTSAGAEEGKSTLSCNLAIALAQSGKRVILVDADMRRPRVAEYMGLVDVPGLSNALIGHVSPIDALQRWGEGALFVLTAGSIPPNPSELLASAAMGSLLRALEEACDQVIVDAPPLLPVSDALAACAHVDGVVLAARHGKTTTESLTRAAQMLDSTPASVLGCVLTLAPTSAQGSTYYYAEKAPTRRRRGPQQA